MAKVSTPPDIGSELVGLKIDPTTHGLRLEQSQLQAVLWKLRDYAKAVGDRALNEARNEMLTCVGEARMEIKLLTSERCAELESDLFKRVQEVEQSAADFGVQVQAMQSRLQEAFDQMSHTSPRSIPPMVHVVPEVSVPRSSPGPLDVNDSIAMSKQSEGVVMAESVCEDSGGAAPQDRTASQHMPVVPVENSVALSGTSANEIAQVQEAVLENNKKLMTINQEMQPLLRKVEELQQVQRKCNAQLKQVTSEVDQIKETRNFPTKYDLDNGLSESRQLSADLATELRVFVQQVRAQLEQVDVRIATTDDGIANLRRRIEIDVASLGEDRQRERQRVDDLARLAEELATKYAYLDNRKAEVAVVDLLNRNVELLRSKLSTMATTVSLEALQFKMDRVTKGVESSAKRTNDELVAVQEEATRLGNRLQEDAETSSTVVKELREQLVALGDISYTIEARALTLESSLVDIQGRIVGVGSKADLADVVSLKNAVSCLAQDAKDKTQTVLFGAKCLSCNRVFDDVSQGAGIVDVQGDRQRTQMFYEMQKALHSPRVDPLKPIKMLAVKVGRPGNVKGVDGAQYQGRDAMSLACGVEDISVMPLRPSLPLGIASGPPPPTPNKLANMPGGKGAGRYLIGSSSPSDVTRACLAGPRDYKHPLSQLIG